MIRGKFLLESLLVVLVWVAPARTFALEYVVGCSIQNEKLEVIRKYYGHICSFLPDGRFLVISRGGLSLVTSSNEVQWTIKGYFHHQINLAQNGKIILALSSKVKTVNGKRIRFDKLLRINFNGHVVSEFDMSKYPLIFKPWEGKMKNDNEEEVDGEASHFNSFYEIPNNKISIANSAFSPGHLIANSLIYGIFIFDSALNKILRQFKYENSNNHTVHDVQVEKDGFLLIYNNKNKNNKNLSLFSSIDVYNPVEKKLVFHYAANPPELFYSDHCGGAQRLENGDILYSDLEHRIFTIDKDEKLKLTKEIKTDLFHLQQVKAYDLSSFLKNNAGI